MHGLTGARVTTQLVIRVANRRRLCVWSCQSGQCDTYLCALVCSAKFHIRHRSFGRSLPNHSAREDGRSDTTGWTERRPAGRARFGPISLHGLPTESPGCRRRPHSIVIIRS